MECTPIITIYVRLPWMILFSQFYIYIPIILPQIVLTIISFIPLLICSFTEPGILPPNLVPREECPIPQSMTKQVSQEGLMVEYKYCITCKIYRDPRSSHVLPTFLIQCSDCDNCVENFDHHCPFTGNCIGIRNYRSFVLFLTFFCIQSTYTIFSAIGLLVIMIVQMVAVAPELWWPIYCGVSMYDPFLMILG